MENKCGVQEAKGWVKLPLRNKNTQENANDISPKEEGVAYSRYNDFPCRYGWRPSINAKV